MDEASGGFDDPVEIGGEHKRAEPRDSLFLQAQFLRPDHPALTLRVRNLSSGGLMADCSEPMIRGERITVEIRGIGSVCGKVAWVREGRIGVAFDVRVDPKLARKPVGAGAPNAAPLIRHVAAPRRPGLRID